MFSLIGADPKEIVPSDWTAYGPVVGGFLALAVLFLKALSEIIKHFASKDKERNDAEISRSEALTKLGDGCHAFQERLQKQQDERTARTDKIVEDLAEIATRVKIALERIEKRLDEEEPPTNHRRAKQ